MIHRIISACNRAILFKFGILTNKWSVEIVINRMNEEKAHSIPESVPSQFLLHLHNVLSSLNSQITRWKVV